MRDIAMGNIVMDLPKRYPLRSMMSILVEPTLLYHKPPVHERKHNSQNITESP